MASPPLRRPPPSRRWLVAARTWVVDEVRLVGPRRVLTVTLALLLAAVVLWWLLRPAPEPVEARLPFASPVVAPAEGDGAPPARPSAGSVVVHVVGEVRRPGLVELAPGSRVADAVDAAGGATAQAQVHALNLAALLRDGQRIHVPHRDEVAVGPNPVEDASVGGASGPGAMVDLNRDGVDRLVTLPGVGPAIAAAIVAHRERHGAFTSIDDLLKVPGIGPAKMEALRDLVAV